MDYRSVVSAWGIDPNYIQQLGGRFTWHGKRPVLRVRTMPGYVARDIFLDGQKPKYKYAEDDGNHPPLFWPNQTGDKLAILTNGEKATLILAQQGLNAANTFGEGNEIPAAIEAIKAAGVTTLLIVPDCDKAGIRAALKWRDLGAAAGLQIVFYDLGVYLSRVYQMTPDEYRKWDLRDLWLLLDQDRELFYQVLFNDLPILNFDDYQEWLAVEPPAIEQVFRSDHQPSGNIDHIQLFEKWRKEEFFSAAARTAPGGNIYKHQRCPLPTHDDHDPSWRVQESGVLICTCDDGRNIHKVAAALGVISWAEYKQQHKPLSITSITIDDLSAAPDDNPVPNLAQGLPVVEMSHTSDKLQALPAALRKAMVTDKETNLARIIDALLSSGIDHDQEIAISDIVEIMHDATLKHFDRLIAHAGETGDYLTLPPKALAYGVNSGQIPAHYLTPDLASIKTYGMGQASIYRAISSFSQKLNIDNPIEIQCSNFEKNSRTGRKAAYFTLASLLVALEKHYSYSINDAGDLLLDHTAALASPKEYRMYSVWENTPAEVELRETTRMIAQKFRLSAGTISGYMRELRAREQMEITRYEKRVILPLDDIAIMPTTIEQFKQDYPQAYIEMELHTEDGLIPFYHAGGKKKKPSNRIPALSSVAMHFFRESIEREFIGGNWQEITRLRLTLVSRMANGYRRIIPQKPAPAYFAAAAD